MIKESSFWRTQGRKALPGKSERVENICNDGMPDVYGCFKGMSYWVELKRCENKRKLRDVYSLLRESQIVWHRIFGIHGAIIYVMVKYPNTIALYKYDYSSDSYLLLANSSNINTIKEEFEKWIVKT